MATQVIEFVVPSGLTVTLSAFTVKTDTAVLTDSACSERTNKKGYYTCTFTGTLAGTYDLVVKVGTDIIATDQVEIINASATFQAASIVGSFEMFKRDFTGMAGEAARSMLNALRHIRNRWEIVSTTKTVYKEDDTTSAWTSTVTGTAGHITADDPA